MQIVSMPVHRLFQRRSPALLSLDNAAWVEICKKWPLFLRLPSVEATALRELSDNFLHKKYIEGVQGLAPTLEMQRVIALFACLPVLKLGIAWYRDWNNIFVSPHAFTDTQRRYGPGGTITEFEDEFAGEVLELGPVVLSWEDVCKAGQGRGYNVVIHEMAHKLDALNGEMDGSPPLSAESRGAWKIAFTEAYHDFCKRAVKASRGRAGTERQRLARLPLDDYAAESPEEFFAVACEVFFERPLRIHKEWPELYACLSNFFKLDPASWI